MNKILNTTTTPPGGWVYIDPETGARFEDINYRAVIGYVRRHHMAMGREIDETWLPKVEQVMIDLNPLIPYQEIGKQPYVPTADSVIGFVQVVRELMDGQPLVSEEEQVRRASICATCPKNGVVNCKWCGWLAREITGMMGGRRHPQIAGVFKRSCMACGCDLTAKTACPLPVLRKVDERLAEPPGYVPGCWMLE